MDTLEARWASVRGAASDQEEDSQASALAKDLRKAHAIVEISAKDAKTGQAVPISKLDEAAGHSVRLLVVTTIERQRREWNWVPRNPKNVAPLLLE